MWKISEMLDMPKGDCFSKAACMVTRGMNGIADYLVHASAWETGSEIDYNVCYCFRIHIDSLFLLLILTLKGVRNILLGYLGGISWDQVLCSLNLFLK